MGVSKNRGTPKWMVYNGKAILKKTFLKKTSGDPGDLAVKEKKQQNSFNDNNSKKNQEP